MQQALEVDVRLRKNVQSLVDKLHQPWIHVERLLHCHKICLGGAQARCPNVTGK